MKIAGKEIKKTWIIGAAVILAVLLIIVIAYATKSSGGGMPGPGGRGGRGGSGNTVSVYTQKTEKTTLHGYVTTNGEIESQNSVSVFPDMGGKVMETSVMLGSSVKKGDIIAYVDPSEPGTNYRRSPVYAPISGSIISTPLKNGTKVSTSTAIAIIGDINNLQVTANVPERYVAVLKTGLKANISVEAYPDVTFKATVDRVSPVVDSSSRTKEVILHFDQLDSRINAGMFAKVILFTQDFSGYPVMPADAVVENGDNYYAYVVNEDSTASKRQIKKGETVDGVVQILEGVTAGEVVVTQGQTSLADGAKVKDISGNVVLPETKKENSGAAAGTGGRPDGAAASGDKAGKAGGWSGDKSGSGKSGRPDGATGGRPQQQ